MTVKDLALIMVRCAKQFISLVEAELKKEQRDIAQRSG